MQELYTLSTEANQIITSAKSLLGLHLVRFKHLVDYSEQGFECVHAKMTHRYFFEGRAAEITQLKAFREQLNQLITKLEQE